MRGPLLQGYKRPVKVGQEFLFPTQNQRDYECKWVNLDYLVQDDLNYMMLLKEKGIYERTQKMFFQYQLKKRPFEF